MKFPLIAMLAAAVAFASLPAGAASFSLNIGRPKQSQTKQEKGSKNSSRRGTASETTVTTKTYECKVSCTLAHNEKSAKASVQAFFATQEIGTSKLDFSSVDVGSFTFTPEEKTFSFTVTSPSCSKTETTRRSGGWRNRRSKKDSSGTTYKGLILRVVSEGKVATVKMDPAGLSRYAKAAKEIEANFDKVK